MDIARDAGRCIFPRRIGFTLRLLELLPATLADRATRLFRFKIRPDGPAPAAAPVPNPRQ